MVACHHNPIVNIKCVSAIQNLWVMMFEATTSYECQEKQAYRGSWNRKLSLRTLFHYENHYRSEESRPGALEIYIYIYRDTETEKEADRQIVRQTGRERARARERESK